MYSIHIRILTTNKQNMAKHPRNDKRCVHECVGHAPPVFAENMLGVWITHGGIASKYAYNCVSTLKDMIEGQALGDNRPM